MSERRRSTAVSRVVIAVGKSSAAPNIDANPCWSKDGGQIFYWNGNTVMAVAVRSGETFAADTPHALFDSPVTPRWGYDVARDGAFYVAGYEASRTWPIVFVSDITANLRSRANAQ